MREICSKINLFFGKDLTEIDEKHEDFAFVNNFCRRIYRGLELP